MSKLARFMKMVCEEYGEKEKEYLITDHSRKGLKKKTHHLRSVVFKPYTKIEEQETEACNGLAVGIDNNGNPVLCAYMDNSVIEVLPGSRGMFTPDGVSTEAKRNFMDEFRNKTDFGLPVIEDDPEEVEWINSQRF